MSSVFFAQFKSYCNEVESDAKALRKRIDEKPRKDRVPDFDFVNRVIEDVNAIDDNFQSIERRVFPHGDKLSRTSFAEVLEKAISVFDANQLKLQQTEDYLKKYDYHPQNRVYTHSSSIRDLLIKEEESVVPDTPNKENCDPTASPVRTPATPASPVNVGLFREVEEGSKTPVLPTRHLSAATQQIIQSESPPLSSDVIYYASPSPAAQPEAGYLTPESPSVMLERSLSTMHHRYDISPPSPDTPVMQSPLKCNFNFTASSVVATTRSLAVSSAPIEIPESPDAPACPPRKVHFSTTCPSDSDEEDPVLTTELALRTSKVLQPRSSTSEGWIPQVTPTEWNTVPSFLKLQVTTDVLNIAVTALNKFIESAQSANKHRLESFTADEMERVVGDKVPASSVKVIVLGLVHLKRLDICTENSIKVYKVRRFY